jgi:hypothetical protein
MKIHISFDYELFFGSASGSAEKCLFLPTQKLNQVAGKHNVPFIFFVDAGYLFQLKKYFHLLECKTIYEKIAAQLKQLHSSGHEIGLHVHPHWEDCVFENGNWVINTNRYKLASFREDEIENIITKYHQSISEIIQEPCHSYRAGGWCIQPFEPIRGALIKNNIFTDSSVYFRGFHNSEAHSYDFTLAEDKELWKFDNDPCKENTEGVFTEIPITPDRISPTFYWNLYFKMKTNPEVYKPFGDGNWLSDKKRIYKQFYSDTNHFATCDGFFASRLKLILQSLEQKNKSRMMVLSHPKSLAPYSFEVLDNFIKTAKLKGHVFSKISSCKN